jgi:hypothetical protein
MAQFLGSSPWIAISRPALTGYGYPAETIPLKSWTAPLVTIIFIFGEKGGIIVSVDVVIDRNYW